MQKTISIFFSALLCFGLLSCSEDVGKASDSIKLSKSKLTFNSAASTQVVTTEGDFWEINRFKVDGEEISLLDIHIYKEDDYMVYEGEWYRVKKGTKELEISVDENKTGKSRTLYIHLVSGNWSGSNITVTQEK